MVRRWSPSPTSTSRKGRATDAGQCIAEAQAVAETLGDRWLQVRSAYELSALRGDLEGNADSAIAALREAIAIAEQLGDLALRLEGHLRMGTLLVNIGKLAEAERECALVTELAKPLGSNRDKARAMYLLSLVAFYRSGPQHARRIATRGLRWQERVGDSYFQVQTLCVLAQCEIAAGAPRIAVPRLRKALAIAEESGGWLVVEICRYLVEALLDLGRFQEAAQVAV